jgi:hypothetical protein
MEITMKMLKAAIAAVLFACATPALALDFTTPLTQLGGKPFETDGKSGPITLGSISETALLTVFPDEQDAAQKAGPAAIDEYAREKVRRYALAVKLHDKSDVTLSADEIALLKRLIGKGYPPVVAGQAWMMLDPAGMPK